YKQHGEGSVLYRVKRKIEYAKAQLRAKFATGGRINPSERRDWPANQQKEGRNLPEKRKTRPAG
ncbi:hypothetical protein, partial [Pseudomonas meliae]|uniref:hypothetical protein n=1 Tax=Pseudomonas meliae TaxID=86176 RepID=UPI0005C802AA